MKIDSAFVSLWGEIRKFRRDPVIVDWDFQQVIYRDIDAELLGGVEVSLEDLGNTSGLTTYKGRQVLLYIPDHGKKAQDVLDGRDEGKKFHVAHCETLEMMKSRNRFERYVATTDMSGDFKIQGSDFIGRGVEGTARLRVCINCIKKLNYLRAQSIGSSQRRAIAISFSLADFFETYSSCFKYLPKRNQVRENDAVYAVDWAAISRQHRESASYTCKACRVCLLTAKDLCHVHHVDGVKSNNSPSNLMVLCAACHRQQPNHEHVYVRYEDMSRISALRHEQGINAADWDAAIRMADTALLGVLWLVRSASYSVPQLAYMEKLPGGEVVSIDCAWPDRRIGIFVLDERIRNVPGWELLGIEAALTKFSL